MRETFKYAWDVLTTPLRFKEITAPSTAQISADTLALYAKDRTGISSLYFKDDAGVEHDLGAITTPQALTRVNDTNVTVTLGGTPATSLLAAVSLTLGWSGTLGLARGGTAADLSATGGAGKVLKQTSVGGAITVATVAASEIASGAALTKVDDTNVTLTLGGTPASSLLAATSLTLGWTGTLAESRGGTGNGSYAVGDLLYASATTTLSKLADVAAGSYLRSGGVTTAPLWSTLVLPNAATANRIVYASATNTYGESANLAYDGTDFLLGSGTRARMSGQNRFRYLNSMSSVTKSASQTGITQGVLTTVTFDQEDYDTDGIHDNVTNNSRLTLPLVGKWKVTYTLYLDFTNVTTPNSCQGRILKNGSTSVIYGNQLTSILAGLTQQIVTGTVDIVTTATTDYVEVQAQVNGASGTFDVLSTAGATRLAALYIGE